MLVLARQRLRLLHGLLRFLCELVELNHRPLPELWGGEVYASPLFLPPKISTFYFNFHLAWFGGLLLRQGHGENAVLELSPDLIGVDRGRHRETASERAIAALNSMITPHGLVFLEFALAIQGEGLVLHADFD